MKKTYKILSAMVAMSLLGTACTDVLEEQPRSQITPEFFSTAPGILGGIAGVYSDMRNLWGTEGFTNIINGGTDETLVGGSGNPNWFTYNGFSTDDLYPLWQIAYQDINTLNGVIEFGTIADIPAQTKTEYLAQAKFLRAFYYYHLVQSFGDVPLKTSFITKVSVADSRQPIKEVYAFIIKDLKEAVAELPAQPKAPFLGKAATQSAALYLLAKTYLSRGWSTAAESGDFQDAYNTANSLITDKAKYGLDLWQDFASAQIKANDYGKETIFVIDHSADLKFGEYTTGSFASGPKENKTSFFFRPNYPVVSVNGTTSGASIIDRDIANGRPFIRIRPNVAYTLDVAFADHKVDSRYFKTFQTVWIANKAAVTPRGTLTVGRDTAIWMPRDPITPERRAAFKGVIFEKNQYLPNVFPSMSKYDDPSRPQVNDASTRALVMFKFSEVYLIAAEAAFKLGQNDKAADMINVLRRRAAWKSTNSAAQNTADADALSIKPADVTLDFILDERTREFYGEGLRWWDLTRTKSLIRRVKQYNPEAAAKIQEYHALRPIPQRQIDAVTEGPKFPQNPGY
jgi:starch-binding outer membrane protein, SusD/RagB family